MFWPIQATVVQLSGSRLPSRPTITTTGLLLNLRYLPPVFLSNQRNHKLEDAALATKGALEAPVYLEPMVAMEEMVTWALLATMEFRHHPQHLRSTTPSSVRLVPQHQAGRLASQAGKDHQDLKGTPVPHLRELFQDPPDPKDHLDHRDALESPEEREARVVLEPLVRFPLLQGNLAMEDSGVVRARPASQENQEMPEPQDQSEPQETEEIKDDQEPQESPGHKDHVVAPDLRDPVTIARFQEPLPDIRALGTIFMVV